MARLFEKREWKVMAAEIVLIFLDISGAFWVERWNETRLEKTREHAILEQMMVDLRADTADLRSNLRSNAFAHAARDSVLGWLRGNEPFDSTTEALFARSLSFMHFFSSSSAYENLKSVGVDLVRDDALRIEITRYYEGSYKFVNTTQDLFVNQPWSRELQPRMIEHFETAFWTRTGRPRSVSALRADAALRTAIASFNDMVEFADSASREALQLAEQLLRHIAAYVGRP